MNLSKAVETKTNEIKPPDMEGNPEETKVIYHIDEEETPYLVKLSKPPSEVTLADFKAGIPVHFHKFKFFFKSKDDDFGVVKEEIIEDQVGAEAFVSLPVVSSWILEELLDVMDCLG